MSALCTPTALRSARRQHSAPPYRRCCRCRFGTAVVAGTAVVVLSVWHRRCRWHPTAGHTTVRIRMLGLRMLGLHEKFAASLSLSPFVALTTMQAASLCVALTTMQASSVRASSAFCPAASSLRRVAFVRTRLRRRAVRLPCGGARNEILWTRR